jgi:hypothetical protein
MQNYNDLYIDIVLFEVDDIVKTSPGGVDYDSVRDDLGWGD